MFRQEILGQALGFLTKEQIAAFLKPGLCIALRCFGGQTPHLLDFILAEEILQIKRAKADAILAPNNGQVLFELSVEGPSSSPSVGTKYNQDDFFCYISTPWGGFEKVHVGFTGRIVEISAKQGQMVRKGQPIAYLEREKE